MGRFYMVTLCYRTGEYERRTKCIGLFSEENKETAEELVSGVKDLFAPGSGNLLFGSRENHFLGVTAELWNPNPDIKGILDELAGRQQR